MKKNLIILVLFIFTPLFCNSQGSECGWTGEADRSNGTSACFNMCFQGYESCEAVFNARYRQKLEELLYTSLNDLCAAWLAYLTGGTTAGSGNGVCDIYTITQDIDSEHWTNIAIATNYLNRCVNTCDGQ